MNQAPSRLAIVASILRKDAVEFSRDRLYVLLSLLGLVCYVGIFWALPENTDETIHLGIHPPHVADLIREFSDVEDEEGVDLVAFETPEKLKAAISGELDLDREVSIGLDFPEGFVGKAYAGQQSTVRVYVHSRVPAEVRNAVSGMAREIAFELAGRGLPVTEPEKEDVILGEDRAGKQVPLRHKMRPIFVFFMLMVEGFALASLLAGEIQLRTATAVLVTPASIGDLLAAKGIFGTVLAFSQAVVLLIAVRGFTAGNWHVLLVALLLGSVMITGIGMISGAAAKDFIGTVFYAAVFMIPLAIPALAVLFPGTASAVVKALPTYGLMATMVGVTAYGDTWGRALPYLGMVFAWDIAIFGAGLWVVKRKVESL